MLVIAEMESEVHLNLFVSSGRDGGGSAGGGSDSISR